MHEFSKNVRLEVKNMILNSGGGHAGGSFSMVEILTSIYCNVLKHDPQNPDWEERDRFILSKGHSSLSLYATLSLSGYFSKALLNSFASENGILMNHTDAHSTPGIEVSTGSLGHGLPIAVGIAMAGQLKHKDYFTICLMGDGECHEGSVWEAAMAASSYGLNRLIAIVDRNRIGNDGLIDSSVNLEPFEEKWKSFGWITTVVDGHDVEEITNVLLSFKKEAKGPYLLIANTIKGRGLINSVSGTGKSHYISGNKEELENLFDLAML